MAEKITILCLCVLLSAAILINPPSGYIYGVGDFTQPINLDSFISSTVQYTWSSNDVGNSNILFPYYPFYQLFSVVQHYVGTQYMLVAYSLFFLLGSFLSFSMSLKLFDLDKDSYIVNIISLVYALNLYTLSRFFNPTPFYSLYVFFPILFALSYRFFLSKCHAGLYLAGFGATLFLSSIAFGNASYFVSLNIVFVVLVSLIFLFFRPNISSFISRSFAFFLVIFLISFSSIVPQLPNLLGQFSQFQSLGSTFNLNDWIIYQSGSFKDMFFLSDGIQFNINTFGIPIIYSGAIISIILLIIVIFAYMNKIKSFRQQVLLLSVLMAVMLFLTNKGKDILEKSLTIQLFANNPVLASLRSFDKTFIFLPFFCLLVISYFLISQKKSVKQIVLILLALSLVPMYPVFQGTLLKNYLGIEPGKDFRSSEYSRIIKIPSEYFDLANKYADDKFDYAILSLPYTSLTSSGWSNFPKWNYVGTDITRQLFTHSIVTIDEPNLLDNWNYGAFWNRQDNERSLWLFSFSGLFNTKYLIYHNDSPAIIVNQTYDKINFYEQNGYIVKITGNKNFSFYEISDKYFLPHVYSSRNVISVNGSVSLFPSLIKLAPQTGPPIYYFDTSNTDTMESKLTGQSVTFDNSSAIKTPYLLVADWPTIRNVSDCTSDMAGEPKIGMQVVPDGLGLLGSLELFSKNHYACVGTVFSVNMTQGSFYRYSVYYKNIIGNKMHFGFILFGKNKSYSYAETFNAPNHDWNRYDVVFSPEEDIQKFETDLYAPSDGYNTNINRFDNLSLDTITPTVHQLPKEIKFALPIIEYTQINPTKYRLVIHQAKDVFPLVFSERFDENWRVYPVPLPISNDIANTMSKYRVLDGNSEHQAAQEEIRKYYDRGWISTLGDGSEKIIQHKSWIDGQLVDTLRETFVVNFISKNYYGTIQNDNLPDGDFTETWFSKSIDRSTHSIANGFSNSWTIDPYELCSEYNCAINPDGSYDFSLIIEYQPQNLLDFGNILSYIAFLVCVFYIIYRVYSHSKFFRKYCG